MLEGTFKGRLVQPSSNEQGQHQLHKDYFMSNLTLNVSKDGASTTSLGKLFQCLNSLTIIFFSFYLV